jgi:hypothetical protein
MAGTIKPVSPPYIGGAMIFSSVLQSLSLAYTQREEGRRLKIVGEAKARLADREAEDALKRGHIAEGKVRAKTKLLIGSQRAALAAQGIRVDVGSARDIQQEAFAFGEEEAKNVKISAMREAYGYKVKASQATEKGRVAEARGKARAADTLLTGAVRASSLAYKVRRE